MAKERYEQIVHEEERERKRRKKRKIVWAFILSIFKKTSSGESLQLRESILKML